MPPERIGSVNNPASGVLVLAATPIGDPRDAAPRLAHEIATVDVIAAEDTRRFSRLCHALAVRPSGSVVSYYEHNEAARVAELLPRLLDSVDVAKCMHLHLESERYLQRALTRARTLQFHFIRILVHADEDLRHGNVFLGVEISRQLLKRKHLVANENSLAWINPAKSPAQERPAPHRDRLGAVIFQENQVVITECKQPIIAR